MRPIHTFAIILLLSLLTACSGRSVDAEYNADVCEELSIKIERRDSLSQEEYTRMIGQNEAILRYLVEQSKAIAEEPSGNRSGSWRQLLADPEYLERFGYMFTLGSAQNQPPPTQKRDTQN
ncbi:MAG: hypothetical protein K2I04_03670, partial [Muribaculaceae bacterium]|nr:hypothetical protein [Muribaculaceae bacterium]